MPKYNTINPIPLEKIHYVCTGGCGLVTNESGKCTSRGCVRNRNPLVVCKCKNGKHGILLTRNLPKGIPLPENTRLKLVTKNANIK
ncbi:MAG: hypothetical protein COU25_02660 [Candidatus Levybacteria bacterium CG10_big_fil_rev_8_21_14_0_10_35_13]|nr:MAG: hypothetical protein COU25_02660 [Candidatus Levybacteria bacterium CG10_big_fil_rev_8_21_14_0_10_35_13]